MLIVMVDDGATRKFYNMSKEGFEALLDKTENFGVEIDSVNPNELPLVDEVEVLNDFGSLAL